MPFPETQDLGIVREISDGFTVVDLVKDPSSTGSLTKSTTPVIDPAMLASHGIAYCSH
jgi:hypothetical protein